MAANPVEQKNIFEIKAKLARSGGSQGAASIDGYNSFDELFTDLLSCPDVGKALKKKLPITRTNFSYCFSESSLFRRKIVAAVNQDPVDGHLNIDSGSFDKIMEKLLFDPATPEDKELVEKAYRLPGKTLEAKMAATRIRKQREKGTKHSVQIKDDILSDKYESFEDIFEDLLIAPDVIALADKPAINGGSARKRHVGKALSNDAYYDWVLEYGQFSETHRNDRNDVIANFRKVIACETPINEHKRISRNNIVNLLAPLGFNPKEERDSQVIDKIMTLRGKSTKVEQAEERPSPQAINAAQEVKVPTLEEIFSNLQDRYNRDNFLQCGNDICQAIGLENLGALAAEISKDKPEMLKANRKNLEYFFKQGKSLAPAKKETVVGYLRPAIPYLKEKGMTQDQVDILVEFRRSLAPAKGHKDQAARTRAMQAHFKS